MSWLAITLFKLHPDRTMEDFRRHSLAFVRPEMMRMPAVLGFRDYAVTGTLDGSPANWDAIEVIEVSDPISFDRDNRGEQGAKVTEQWLPWVERFEVLVCQNLAAHDPSDGRSRGPA